jgi:Carbonic anhydrase
LPIGDVRSIYGRDRAKEIEESMTASHSAADSGRLPPLLSKGYQAFRSGRLGEEQGRFRDLAKHGQEPPALLIGCCDSRVSPETIFNAGPGEIFVVRNIAALVPPYAATGGREETSAAIEYAVQALQVGHIVVMGHAQCGGVRAFAAGAKSAFKPLSEANFIGRWKTLIQPAADKLGPPTEDFDAYCERLCHASIIQALANLRSYPWVKAREDHGQLKLHGAYFGIADGHADVARPGQRRLRVRGGGASLTPTGRAPTAGFRYAALN